MPSIYFLAACSWFRTFDVRGFRMYALPLTSVHCRFLLETSQKLVGDGSILPPEIYPPFIPLVVRRRQNIVSNRAPCPSLKNPLHLTYLDILVLILFNAVQYAIFFAFIATLPTLFKSTYPHLNETEISL